MKKNMNGFTLVELLVTISIMLTILVISIISLVNLSKRRKEEAYKQVAKQIENAAEDYFMNNEYLFEGLSTGSIGKISLGKLIDEDYLNVTTNPKTGKKFSYCSYVEVSKNKNVYETEFKETNDNSSDCDSNYSIIVSEKSAPVVSIKITGSKYNNWYNSNDTKAILTINSTGSASISSVSASLDSKNVNYNIVSKKYVVPLNDDTKSSTIRFTVKNADGKTAVVNANYKKDSTPPSCSVSISGSNKNGNEYKNIGWYTSNVTLNGKCSDDISGCKESIKTNYTKDIKINKRTPGKVYDKAGNSTTCESKTFGIDKTKPNCSVTMLEGTKGNDKWYLSSVKFKGACTDSTSECKIDSVTESFTKEQLVKKTTIGTVIDKAGNKTVCQKEFGIDKTKPECSVKMVEGTKGNGNWYIGSNVEFKASCKNDSISECSSITKTKKFSKEQIVKETEIGEISDKAGNKITCTKTFGFEKNISISFNLSETNNSKSIKNNKYVFDTTKDDVCKFGKCENIKAFDTKPSDSNLKADKTFPDKYKYFARSCMYVDDYLRYFNVSAISKGDKITVCALANLENETKDIKNNNDCYDTGLKRISKYQQTKKDFNEKYNIKQDKLTSTVSASRDKWQYTTPAGNKSDDIILYIEYRGACGY